MHVAAGQEQRMLPAVCTKLPPHRCLYLMPLICENKRKLPRTLHRSCTYKRPYRLPLTCTCTCRRDKGELPSLCTQAALHRCLHKMPDSPATAGQEKRELPGARHTACTVEMAQVHKPVAVAVVDEIQMVAERSRGWSFTRALLGVAAAEVHVCGDPAVLPLLEQMVDDAGGHRCAVTVSATGKDMTDASLWSQRWAPAVETQSVCSGQSEGWESSCTAADSCTCCRAVAAADGSGADSAMLAFAAGGGSCKCAPASAWGRCTPQCGMQTCGAGRRSSLLLLQGTGQQQNLAKPWRLLQGTRWKCAPTSAWRRCGRPGALC